MNTSTTRPTITPAVISAAILARINAGYTTQQAFDAVMGEGAYMKLAGDLYDSLRAKSA